MKRTKKRKRRKRRKMTFLDRVKVETKAQKRKKAIQLLEA